MPKVEHTIQVDASPDDIFEFLIDESYFSRLQEKLDKVSNIELRERQELDDGRYRRVLHYTAPTQLPGLLRRFKSRAPENINWDETAIIDGANHTMLYEIVPEMPEHWHERYDSKGHLAATSTDAGRSRIEQSMIYSIDAPAGFGMFINRAIKSELINIFEAHAEIIKERYER